MLLTATPHATEPPAPATSDLDLRFEQYRKARHLRALDGLRCVSILAVIWHHAAGAERTGLANQGWNGVNLFFAISGFLITTLLLRERDEAGHISLSRFYARRSLRIFPLYYLTIAIYTALVFATKDRHTPAGHEFFGNLKYFITYTSNWFIDFAGNKRVIFYFAWSLATEEQFYLLWPSVIRYTRSWQVPVLVLLVGTAVSVTANQMYPVQLVRPPVWARIVGSVQPAICLGAVLAFALHARAGYRVVAKLLGGWWGVPLAVGSVILALTVGHRWPDLAAPALVLLVAALMVRPRNVLSPLLDNRVARYVGMVSYGMYMMHMIAMQFAHKASARVHGGGIATFFLAIPITIAIASASYWFFEQPFLRLKKRFSAPHSAPIHNAQAVHANAAPAPVATPVA